MIEHETNFHANSSVSGVKSFPKLFRQYPSGFIKMDRMKEKGVKIYFFFFRWFSLDEGEK